MSSSLTFSMSCARIVSVPLVSSGIASMAALPWHLTSSTSPFFGSAEHSCKCKTVSTYIFHRNRNKININMYSRRDEHRKNCHEQYDAHVQLIAVVIIHKIVWIEEFGRGLVIWCVTLTEKLVCDHSELVILYHLHRYHDNLNNLHILFAPLTWLRDEQKIFFLESRSWDKIIVASSCTLCAVRFASRNVFAFHNVSTELERKTQFCVVIFHRLFHFLETHNQNHNSTSLCRPVPITSRYFEHVRATG